MAKTIRRGGNGSERLIEEYVKKGAGHRPSPAGMEMMRSFRENPRDEQGSYDDCEAPGPPYFGKTKRVVVTKDEEQEEGY